MGTKYYLKADIKRTRVSSIIQGNGKPLIASQIGRNEKCPCGSGKKVKHCHGSKTIYKNTND